MRCHGAAALLFLFQLPLLAQNAEVRGVVTDRKAKPSQTRNSISLAPW
jgi:hypothetical protein